MSNYKNCEKCRICTLNSNDGGPLLCYEHELVMLVNRDNERINVIAAKGTADDMTCYYKLKDIKQFIQDLLETYSYKDDQDVDNNVQSFNPRVIEMTLEEFERIPEL